MEGLRAAGDAAQARCARLPAWQISSARQPYGKDWVIAHRREIRLNAFDMNCVGHQSPGLWRHPRDRSRDYTDLDYWTDLAQHAGARAVRRRVPRRRARRLRRVRRRRRTRRCAQAAQVPVNDPLLLVPAMAAVTEHLGFGVTGDALLRAALPVRPPHVDARPSDRGPRSAGTSSPAISTAPPRGMGLQQQTRARRPLRRRRGIHGGRLQALGRQLGGRRGRARRGSAACSPTRARCARCATTARTTSVDASISASPRRSARRCSTRPAPRRRAAASRRAMPNACSSPARRSRCCAPRVAAIRDRAVAQPGATRADC